MKIGTLVSRQANGKFAPAVPKREEMVKLREQGKFFNWNAFLSRKTCTEKDYLEAIRLASEWVTCACGNLCDAIPRYIGISGSRYGSPKDDKLVDLGYQFMGEIENRKVDSAKITLQQIEERSAEILQLMTPKVSACANAKLS